MPLFFSFSSPFLLFPSSCILPFKFSSKKGNILNSQPPRQMATRTLRLRTAILHRQHEPLRRHIYCQRRAASPTRRGWRDRCARRSRVPSSERLGGGRHSEWEALFMDVTCPKRICVNKSAKRTSGATFRTRRVGEMIAGIFKTPIHPSSF